jgi:pimeloyl-ACP methyl ester carboxylesterase
VDIGGEVRLHVHDMGEGGPTVILEAGLAATSLNWRVVQRALAESARVVSYDRAGLGWSSPRKAPQSCAGMAKDLKAALRAAGIEPPYVMVGHSFGGLIARRFTLDCEEEVAGLVLLDPMPVPDWYPLTDKQRKLLWLGRRLARRGATLARWGMVRALVSTALQVQRLAPRALGRTVHKGGQSVVSRLVARMGSMPKEVWPMAMAHWSDQKSYQGIASHLEGLPACAAEMAAALPVRGIPVTVILPAGEAEKRAAEIEALAPGAKVLEARGTGHWIHLDEPELVVEHVRAALETVTERC